MKIYLVGGAVRDELMGVPSKDRDYVVVGSTHEEMMALGFEQVGAAFPVYLHPETKEEYALARTERSTGAGYHDFEVVFSPDVTIEEDLARRDLTINAIAKDLDTGEYVDPFGGMRDLQRRVLRQTTVNTMRDDPLRTYRLARLYARFGGKFVIDHSTAYCAKEAAPQLMALPKERKMAEIRKCFEDQGFDNRPSLMVDMLCNLGEMPEVASLRGALQPPQHHPEGDAYVHTLLCLDYAQSLMSAPETKWAVLCHDLGKVQFFEYGNLHGHEESGLGLVASLGERFGVPNKWADLAHRVCADHTRMHRINDLKPKKVFDLIERLKAQKDPQFALKFMEACLCDARGRGPEKMFDLYDQPHVLWAGVAELHKHRSEISEKCKEIAERRKGHPEKIKMEVRSLKTGYVARALERVKAEIKKIRVEEGNVDSNLPTWRLY
ncbi:tRNA nucleotidyltransferase [Pectobacterium phage POP15]|nr:tRNA nucleotidyltransferase [Pectobacterium phage POP15]